MAVSCMHTKKHAIYPLFMGGISKIPASYRKSGSRNTMVTSDFRLEVRYNTTKKCIINVAV